VSEPAVERRGSLCGSTGRRSGDVKEGARRRGEGLRRTLQKVRRRRDLATVDALGLYRTMVRIRRFEERVEQLFLAGKLPA